MVVRHLSVLTRFVGEKDVMAKDMMNEWFLGDVFSVKGVSRIGQIGA
jgi:hypothetical protein